MVWCIMNDLDYAAAKATPLDNRVPFLEYVCIKLRNENSVTSV